MIASCYENISIVDAISIVKIKESVVAVYLMVQIYALNRGILSTWFVA